LDHEGVYEALDVLESFRSFIRNFRDDSGNPKYYLELSNIPISEARSLLVDFQDLITFNKDLATELAERPLFTLGEMEKAAYITLGEIDSTYIKHVKKVNIRVRGFPRIVSIRKINSSLINKFVSLDGVVVRVTATKSLLNIGAFKCSNCGAITKIQQSGYLIKSPKFCSSCRASGPELMDFVPEESSFQDIQFIRLQERPEDLPPGSMPQNMELQVSDDLVDIIRPGDRIRVTGVVIGEHEQMGPFRGKSRIFELRILVNNVEAVEEKFELSIDESDQENFRRVSKDPWFYHKLIRSIAPSIHGMEDIKEAILLQLAGGVPRTFRDGVRVRGDINILLVGDPGTAKSQLLKYVQRIAPRGLYTSGRGTTAAGLTAAVVRDKTGAFALEAGALVLADMGVAAIDEFEKMRPEDRVAIHEAMEQQTCSVAKGGIVATLNARTAILSAANPVFGRYDPNRNFADNVNLPPTVLSRFDLFFVIRDIPNPEDDAKLSDKILEQHRMLESSSAEVFESSFLRKYLAFCKKVNPALSEEAANRIKSFFLEMRAASVDSPIQATPRQLESVIRIATARARLLLKDFVEIDDVEAAIALIRKSLSRASFDVHAGVIDVDVIMTGKPKSSREKMSILMNTINELEKSSGKAMLEELYTELEKKGLSRTDAEKILQVLLKEGILYSPDGESVKRSK
jgi:replicative DNA helicase Mcm